MFQQSLSDAPNLSITMSTASSVSGLPHTGQNSAFVQTTSLPTVTENPSSSKREHSQFSGFLPSLLHQEHPLHTCSTRSRLTGRRAGIASGFRMADRAMFSPL